MAASTGDHESPGIHIFSSSVEADSYINKLEVDTGVRYIRQKSRTSIITDITSLKQFGIFFKHPSGKLDSEGTPFVILDSELRECCQGPTRHKPKRKPIHDDHDVLTTSKTMSQNTKKVGCRAQIVVKTILTFPDYKLIGPDTKYARRKQVTKLRKEYGPDTVKVLHVIVTTTGEHTGHQTGQLADFSMTIDRRVSDYISSLVSRGIRNVDEVIGRVKEFVPSIVTTRETNRRFYPNRKSVYNIMYDKLNSARHTESDIKAMGETKSCSEHIPLFLQNKPKDFISHCLQRMPPKTQALEPQDIVFQSADVCTVKSPESGNFYQVTFVDMMPFCACPDFDKHHLPCTHILGIIMECPDYGWDFLNRKYTEQPCFNINSTVMTDNNGQPPRDSNSDIHIVNEGLTDNGSEHDDTKKSNLEKNSVMAERKACLKVISDIQNSICGINNFEELNKAKKELQTFNSNLVATRQCTLPVRKTKTVKRKLKSVQQKKKVFKKNSYVTEICNNDVVVDGTYSMNLNEEPGHEPEPEPEYIAYRI